VKSHNLTRQSLDAEASMLMESDQEREVTQSKWDCDMVVWWDSVRSMTFYDTIETI